MDTPRRTRRHWALAPCLALMAGAVGIGASSAAAATNFYVAPNGSDSAPGTLSQPFATLQRAQTAVRGVTAGMTTDIVVNVRGGTYAPTAALDLTNAAGDSGKNGHTVVYRAYNYGTASAETPVISGGRAITGWTQVDATNHIWRADVGTFSTRQLYRGDQRLAQGSLPALPGTVTQTSTGYKTTSTAPQSWSDPSNVEFTFTQTGYSQAQCGVASISGTATQTTITMDQPCFNRMSKVYSYNDQDPNSPYDLPPIAPVKNSRSFLTTARTWSIDRATSGHHYIYYRSDPGENPNSSPIIAPQLAQLVTGTGTEASPLHDVAFKGLTFKYSTWLAPDGNKGLVHIFGDYIYDGGSPSGSLTEPTTQTLFVPDALSFKNASEVTLEGNRFAHLGSDAVDFTGTKGNTVRGNVFTDLAGGALKLDGIAAQTDADNLVEDNYIHDVGNDYEGSIAVYLEDIFATTLQHNQINDVPYSGISATISEATTPHGIKILSNKIFDTVNVMMDGGGIYTSGPQGSSYANGAVIDGNDVHGTINPAFEAEDPNREVGAPNAMYTDVNADYIKLRHNVIYDNHQSWGGVSPGHMRFINNYWDDDQLVWYGPTTNLVINNNTLLPTTNPRPACQAIAACNAILDGAGLETAWTSLLTP